MRERFKLTKQVAPRLIGVMSLLIMMLLQSSVIYTTGSVIAAGTINSNYISKDTSIESWDILELDLETVVENKITDEALSISVIEKVTYKGEDYENVGYVPIMPGSIEGSSLGYSRETNTMLYEIESSLMLETLGVWGILLHILLFVSFSYGLYEIKKGTIKGEAKQWVRIHSVVYAILTIILLLENLMLVSK